MAALGIPDFSPERRQLVDPPPQIFCPTAIALCHSGIMIAASPPSRLPAAALRLAPARTITQFRVKIVNFTAMAARPHRRIGA